MMKANCLSIWVVLFACFLAPNSATAGWNQQQGGGGCGGTAAVRQGPVVRKDERRSLLSTENGQISAVKITDGAFRSYYLQFITMQPNSLFLPVYLQTDMLLYVNSGSGSLSWMETDGGGKIREVKLRQGDVYRLPPRTFFYITSNLDEFRQQLAIHAIFVDSTDQQLREGEPVGAYVSLPDMVVGFNSRVLQAALQVPENVVEEIKRGGSRPLIVGGVPKLKNSLVEASILRMMQAFLPCTNNVNYINVANGEKTYSFLTEKRDFESVNGWVSMVTEKRLKALKDTNLGVFIVNLTQGSMMGPHWNPMAVEIAVVLRGRGMVQVICPSSTNETLPCRNLRFRVEEGDVFVVPRHHPVVQMSFNDESFVFVGFTRTTKEFHLQYVAGKDSVFNTLDEMVLATSFNVSAMTIDQIAKGKGKSVILECISCAEDEEMEMVAEREREEEQATAGGGGGGQEQPPRQGEGEATGGGGGGQEQPWQGEEEQAARGVGGGGREQPPEPWEGEATAGGGGGGVEQPFKIRNLGF